MASSRQSSSLPADNGLGPPRTLDRAYGVQAEQPQGQKVALPSFGNLPPAANQAAYLGYIGAPLPGAAAAPAPGNAETLGFVPLADNHYPAPRAAAPPRKQQPRPAANPALQAWQEDPFSEWRN